MDILEIMQGKRRLQTVVLPGASSQEFVPQNMPLCNDSLYNCGKNMKKGIDYAEKYIKEEEKEVFQIEKYLLEAHDGKLDDISLGTFASINDVSGENLTKVYETYNFAHRLPDNLVITSLKDHILSMIETNRVVVIRGPTGCGKTTQVPQFILDSCYEKKVPCNIIVTQPRRIAASSIAKRVSKERNWPLGSLVGFKVGMVNNTSPDTRLTYCTTGVLLQKLIAAKNMLNYTHIILDEVHERDQEMDFLMLVVRKFLRTNSRTVKVILMSATFDVEKFTKYFSTPAANQLEPAPVIDITQKRNFVLNIYYLCELYPLGPLPEVSESIPKASKEMMEFCVQLIVVLDEIDAKSEDQELNEGDAVRYNRHTVLIFLPGIAEIEEMYNALTLHERKHENMKWDIVILHSLITSEDQDKIFRSPPEGSRRLILSTNIAESSITVADVKYVIDFCLTKQIMSDPDSNFQYLELAWASKANCEQRAGRTGRVMHGRVYRLVPRSFYERVLPDEGSPEMLRAPLENVVLKAKLLNMGEPKAILALSLDPPDFSNLERTILVLKEAGALLNIHDEKQYLDGELTDLGKVMAALPLDIHITKLIVLGHLFSVLTDAIIIGCSMAVKDMFCNPFKKKLLAYNAKLSWASDSDSDCIAFLNVYKVWTHKKANRILTSNAMEKEWAQRNFVQIRVLREVQALVHDVTNRLKRFGITESVGVNRVSWDDKDKPFILKVVIAGAFYPNYFVRFREIDEFEAFKAMGGLDPLKTVYLQGWPTGQPGPLYARKFQNIFKECLFSVNEEAKIGNVRVSFDMSSRIYIRFNKDTKKGNDDVDRRAILPLYKAIKLRQINGPIEIPVLPEKAALQLAEELNIGNNLSKVFYDKSSINRDQNYPTYKRPNLPSLDMSYIPLIIITIIDPGHFWVRLNDDETSAFLRIVDTALNEQSLHEFHTSPDIGALVAVQYEEKNESKYYRGVVQSYSKQSGNLYIYCKLIDIGCTVNVQKSEIRRITNYNQVARIPPLALECVLANVQPSVVQTHNRHWSQEAFAKIYKLRDKANAKLFGEIFSVVNNVVSLNLIEVTDAGGKININQQLISENLATWKEEDYLSRYNNELRKNCNTMTSDQISQYEKMQYDEGEVSEKYPDPCPTSECVKNVRVRGPFSPLECNLYYLPRAGRAKVVKVESTSVNSVLLEPSTEKYERLLVAGTVNQSRQGTQLILRNTTLMPAIPDLKTLLVLIFTPKMELRRSSHGTYYVGALCGLGYDPITNQSIFPEHDIELYFDVEITLDDLQEINKLRHWMNVGMYVSEDEEKDEEEILTCQRRIKTVLSTLLMSKVRKVQNYEMINGFSKWNRYCPSLFMSVKKVPMVKNNIYELHKALNLEENVGDIEEMTTHLKELQYLAAEDWQKVNRMDISCKLCGISISNVFQLRTHLYSTSHRENEEKLNLRV